MRVQNSFARRLSITALSCSSGTSSPTFMNSSHYTNTEVNKVYVCYVQDGRSVSICGFVLLLFLFLVFEEVKLKLTFGKIKEDQWCSCHSVIQHFFILALAQYQIMLLSVFSQ